MTRTCKYFSTSQGCTRGTNCKYLHSVPLSTTSLSAQTAEIPTETASAEIISSTKSSSVPVTTTTATTSMGPKLRIGIDFGGVISGKTKEEPNEKEEKRGKKREDTAGFFGDDYLNSPATEQCFPAIKVLVERYGADNLFIVSKAGDFIQKRTEEWLNYNKFWSQTGMLPSNTMFCYKRNDKAILCAPKMINVFIDDHVDCLSPMISSTEKKLLLWFNPNSKDLSKYKDETWMKDIVIVYSWSEVITQVKIWEEDVLN